ncbi:MAG TPA: hypothetical protein VGD39_19115 [Nocardioides sp.]
MRITRLVAGTVTAGLLGITPLAVTAPARADGQTYTPVVNAKLTITSSPYEAPYMYGGGFYVSGDITDPSGIEHPSGGQAFLQVITASNPTWTTIATDDSPGYLFFDGDFEFTENAQYKVVFTGSTAQGAWDDSYVAGESAPIAAPVTRKVEIGNAKARLTIKGKVKPDYKRKKVKVQIKKGKRFVKFKSVKTTRKSTFQVRLPAPRRGKKLYFKITVPGNTQFASYSEVWYTASYRSSITPRVAPLR